MKTCLLIFSICFQIFGIESFLVIPDEVPSLLSVIYSNIPIIKKGTDSRIGWGFRIGDRADFQVLVELGPQKYTQPLGNEPNKVVSNKRNTENDFATQLWIQRQEDKKRAKQKEQMIKSPISNSQSWLEQWSREVKKNKPIPQVNENESLGIGEIDAKLVIPEDDDDIKHKNLSN